MKLYDHVHILDENNWRSDLLASIPEDVLPPLWGGTNSDCSVLRQICPEFAGIKMGGMVPLYYQSNQKLNDLPGNSSKILFFQS